MKKRLRELALSDTGFLFDPITGHMYTLNRTGSAIIQLLRDGIPESDLPSRLSERFDVPAEEAERDCLFFLGSLREHRLIEA